MLQKPVLIYDYLIKLGMIFIKYVKAMLILVQAEKVLQHTAINGNIKKVQRLVRPNYLGIHSSEWKWGTLVILQDEDIV